MVGGDGGGGVRSYTLPLAIGLDGGVLNMCVETMDRREREATVKYKLIALLSQLAIPLLGQIFLA